MSIAKTESQDFSKENEINQSLIENQWYNWVNNKNDDKYLTVFIRVPFCLDNKCKYCLYTSQILHNCDRDLEIEKYLIDLDSQMRRFSNILKTSVKSIYIGGGTPSILSINQLKRLFDIINKHINIDTNTKNMFNFESNPTSLTKEKIDYLINKTLVNRISIGVQSLSRDVLKYQNRDHLNIYDTSLLLSYVKETFEKSNKTFNFNVDLIAGLELQNIEIMKNDFKFLSKLEIPKITIYNRRFTSHHTKDSEMHLRNNFDKFLYKLLEFIEQDDNYYFEKIITERAWINLINKKNNIEYDYIYIDKPINFVGKKNSCISFGPDTFSWIDTDFGYYYHNNRYYYWNQFYTQLDIIKDNIENYSFVERKRFYY